MKRIITLSIIFLFSQTLMAGTTSGSGEHRSTDKKMAEKYAKMNASNEAKRNCRSQGGSPARNVSYGDAWCRDSSSNNTKCGISAVVQCN